MRLIRKVIRGVLSSTPDAHREGLVTDTLEELIARTRTIRMDEGQLRQQRLSFVYGNTHIENERITREIVAQADVKVMHEEAAEAERMS